MHINISIITIISIITSISTIMIISIKMIKYLKYYYMQHVRADLGGQERGADTLALRLGGGGDERRGLGLALAQIHQIPHPCGGGGQHIPRASQLREAPATLSPPGRAARPSGGGSVRE